MTFEQPHSLHLACQRSLLMPPYNSVLKDFFLFFQALCGSRVEGPLLGGDRMMVNLQDEIVKPSTVKRIVSKGLPLPKDPGRKGDLIINFDIVFPERLPSATKEVFRSHLPNLK